MQRPDPSEHHAYYSTYIDKVPDADVLAILQTGIDETAALFADRPDAIADHRYAPGKWTVREVLIHLIDSERTFGFRAFWFARGAADPLPSFDQESFVRESRVGARTLDHLFAEWRTVRAANITLFESIDDEVSRRTGIASGYRFSVRAFPWIIAGHEIHHRQLFAEQYLR
jgi:hypothetical protein